MISVRARRSWAEHVCTQGLAAVVHPVLQQIYFLDSGKSPHSSSRMLDSRSPFCGRLAQIRSRMP